MKLPVTRYERTMKNGLKVILLHKPDFAKSLFMFGIPAGGSTLCDEKDGVLTHRKAGCAHYLEHQMFRLNGADVTPLLADAQAKTNAFTSYDETCYYVWTNSDPYRPLELLMDFVQTLDIDEQSVSKEKGIILSEYAQYDQDPESRILSETLRSLYHVYPMREEILGRPEDIRSISIEDLTDFYNAWYDPAQMVLTGISAQDPEKLFAWIEKQEEKYPSRYPDGNRPVLHTESEPQSVSRKSALVKMDVDLQYACLGVKLDALGDAKESVEKDYMLNLYLTSQFSSLNPEYQTWIDERLMGMSNGSEADLTTKHGYILIYAQTDKPEEYLAAMKRVLKEKKPMSEEIFESLIRREKASSIRLADRFDPLAAQTVSGYFEGIDPLDDLQILNGLDAKKINDWIETLDFSRQVETVVVPLEASEEKEHNA